MGEKNRPCTCRHIKRWNWWQTFAVAQSLKRTRFCKSYSYACTQRNCSNSRVSDPNKFSRVLLMFILRQFFRLFAYLKVQSIRAIYIDIYWRFYADRKMNSQIAIYVIPQHFSVFVWRCYTVRKTFLVCTANKFPWRPYIQTKANSWHKHEGFLGLAKALEGISCDLSVVLRDFVFHLLLLTLYTSQSMQLLHVELS